MFRVVKRAPAAAMPMPQSPAVAWATEPRAGWLDLCLPPYTCLTGPTFLWTVFSWLTNLPDPTILCAPHIATSSGPSRFSVASIGTATGAR